MKGLTYQACARIANTSQGSVGKEVFKMKEELAIKRGLDISEAKNISTAELRKYLADEGKASLEKSPKKERSIRIDSKPADVEMTSSNEFDFEISSEPLEIERF